MSVPPGRMRRVPVPALAFAAVKAASRPWPGVLPDANAAVGGKGGVVDDRELPPF